jgi:hypothetical protein
MAGLGFILATHMPFLYVYVLCPALFMFAAYEYALLCINWSKYEIFDKLVKFLFASYMVYLWYACVASIERYLSGQPIFIHTFNLDYFGKLVVGLVIGVMAGVIVFWLRDIISIRKSRQIEY